MARRSRLFPRADVTDATGRRLDGFKAISATEAQQAVADGAFSAVPAYNVKLNSRKKWRKAVGRVLSGGGSARILTIGDSTDWGFNAGGADGAPPSKVLAGMLDRSYAPTDYNFLVPPGKDAPLTGGSITDERWSAGSGWGANATFGLGGKGVWLWSTTSASTPLVAAPGVDADRFDIYYLRLNGNGSFTATLDTGESVTQATAGSPTSIQKVTLSAAAVSKTHTVSIVTSTAAVAILGIEAYVNGRSSIRVSNAGLSSSRLFGAGTMSPVGWADSGAARSYEFIRMLAPDMTLIRLGINDARLESPTSGAQWETSMRALIPVCKESGDVVIASVIPSSPSMGSGAPLALEEEYRSRTMQIATDLDCTYLDVFGRYGSYADASAAGYMSDTIHLTAAGGADLAEAYRRVIVA